MQQPVPRMTHPHSHTASVKLCRFTTGALSQPRKLQCNYPSLLLLCIPFPPMLQSRVSGTEEKQFAKSRDRFSHWRIKPTNTHQHLAFVFSGMKTLVTGIYRLHRQWRKHNTRLDPLIFAPFSAWCYNARCSSGCLCVKSNIVQSALSLKERLK